MPARRGLATPLLVVLVVLVACGGASSPEPRLAATEATSGTRLKARWYAAPEGPVTPREAWNDPFHDTALDLDCGFVLAGDGAWRCLPRTSVFDVDETTGPYFNDDRCTSPLVRAAASCLNPAPTQLGFRTNTCPVLERRLAVGAAVAADAPVFFLGWDGSCAATSPTAALRATLHQLGAEIDYAAYASAERRDGSPLRGFAEAALVADDGAVQPLGFVASGTSELLSPDLASDGAVRLLPVGASDRSGGSAFADDTCTTSAITIAGSCTAAPAHAVLSQWSGDACPSALRVHALGARLPATYGHTAPSGSCGSIGLPGQTAFALGAELPPSSFSPSPALSPSVLGRLTRSARGVARTWRWGEAVVHDTQLGAQVRPVHAGDGSFRWLPTGPTVFLASARYFSDFECTRPLVVVEGDCSETRRYGAVIRDCRVGEEIHPLVPYAGAVLEKAGAHCYPVTRVVGPAFALGDPIPPETFLPVTIVLR